MDMSIERVMRRYRRGWLTKMPNQSSISLGEERIRAVEAVGVVCFGCLLAWVAAAMILLT